MNHITQLTQDRTALLGAIHVADIQINSQLAFLSSAKFTGTESDGSRKDWISTSDVVAMLRSLRETLSNHSVIDSARSKSAKYGATLVSSLSLPPQNELPPGHLHGGCSCRGTFHDANCVLRVG